MLHRMPGLPKASATAESVLWLPERQLLQQRLPVYRFRARCRLCIIRSTDGARRWRLAAWKPEVVASDDGSAVEFGMVRFA